MSAPQAAGETAGTGGSNARTSAQAVLGSPEGQPLKKRGKEREQPDGAAPKSFMALLMDSDDEEGEDAAGSDSDD